MKRADSTLVSQKSGKSLSILGRRTKPSKKKENSYFSLDQKLNEPALITELLAECLDLGITIQRAIEILEPSIDSQLYQQLTSTGKNLSNAQLKTLRSTLKISEEIGAPSKQMLVSQAKRMRKDKQFQLERNVEELGVKIVVPLGICILPAFFALGVVPVVISLAHNTF